MAKKQIEQAQLEELLYQALETELGGVEVYRTALTCASNEELMEEWQRYLEQTEEHVAILREVFAAVELDADRETPGRVVVRHIGESLVKAMKRALESAPREAAEIVAAECIVFAETKDHMNWELIGLVLEEGGALSTELKKALRDAFKKVEEQEDEHLYHDRLGAGALGAIARASRGASAARGGARGEDRDRGRARSQGAQGASVEARTSACQRPGRSPMLDAW
jgi:hypothetical protein